MSTKEFFPPRQMSEARFSGLEDLPHFLFGILLILKSTNP
jgi:hypothetical protein